MTNSSDHRIQSKGMVLITCKYSLSQPLNPVLPHVEADQGFEAIEGPDPDLGDQI